MTSAFILVQVAPGGAAGDIQQVHKALHAVPGVKTVHFLAGPTDAILFVEAADPNGLMETVGKIRSVKGVGTTDTRIVLPL